MKENNEDIKQKFKLGIVISQIKSDENKKKFLKKGFNIKKYGLVACFCIMFITGTAFAKDIENFIKDKFGIGLGVQTAVENGYVSELNEEIEFINSDVTITKENSDEVLDTFETGIRITDFLMTDTTLTLNMEIKFDKKINQYKNLNKIVDGNIDYEGFGNIKFDLFILDDENKLICSPSINEEYIFNNFCDNHNLNLEYLEFSENYLNCITNYNIREIDPETNIIKITCVISGDEMPKSKELNIYFNKITFAPKENLEDFSEYFFLSGNWEINLDVPNEMYNREDISYKMISCDNDSFDVYEAKATDIGFIIGITISDIYYPECPEELLNRQKEIYDEYSSYTIKNKEDFIKLYGDSKYVEMYSNFMNKSNPIRLTGNSPVIWEEATDGCYIINSNGDKFLPSSSLIYNQNSNFKYEKEYDENGFAVVTYLNEYNFYDMFEMTKYNATNRINVIIDFYGKPVNILLEKE